MIKLSVVVPVYNVEEYIYECIDSILNQTIDNMEVIVVDDGSTDNSIQVVEGFKDERIKIIRKSNGGLSSARNIGLDEAKGKYISFIDSDDYIGFNTAFDEMYNIGIEEDADIIVGNAIKYISESEYGPFIRDSNIFKRQSMTSSDFLLQFKKTYSMHSSACFNIYKMDLLRENKIKFKEGYLHEDEDFTPRVFLRSSTISIYPKNFYIYRAREGSIIMSKNIKKGYDLINICIGLQNELDSIENEELRKIMKEDTVALLLRTSYRNKVLKLPKGAKLFVLKNTYNIKLKLHSLLYSFNNKLYYKFLDYKKF